MKNYYLRTKKTSNFVLLLILFLLCGKSFSQTCGANGGNPTFAICETDAMPLVGVAPSDGISEWVQVSGPAVIIDNPFSAATFAIGYSGGNTYGFRYNVTCNDGSGVAFQDV